MRSIVYTIESYLNYILMMIILLKKKALKDLSLSFMKMLVRTCVEYF